MSGRNALTLITNTEFVLPVLFYFVWYFISSVIGNLVVGESSEFTGFGGRAISIGTNHISYHIYNISFVHTCIEPNIQLGSPTTVTHIRS